MKIEFTDTRKFTGHSAFIQKKFEVARNTPKKAIGIDKLQSRLYLGIYFIVYRSGHNAFVPSYFWPRFSQI